MCRWLIDPSLSPAQVRHRGAIAQLVDYRLRRQFEASLPEPPAYSPPAKTAAERERDHRADMRRYGLDEGSEPDMLTLFTRYAIPGRTDGGWLYRLLSAYSHGRQWTSLTGNVRAEPAQSGPLYVAAWTANEGGAQIIAQRAILALSQALAEFEQFATAPPP